MGNSNSGHLGVTQPPPPWTQSLPRDTHRQRKHGGAAQQQRTKVLPERIPGQRLKPTENGRNLQVQGTISPRKVSSEIPRESSNFNNSFGKHHSSMSSLNQPQQHNLPVSFFPPSSGSITDLRLGLPPSKSFTSEPDLRGSSPSSNKSVPSQQQHKIAAESPTKEKIKSKKRNKAPPPPMPLQSSISFPLDYRMHPVPSPLPADNWSSASSPAPKNQQSKPRKMGLFKKRSESRMSKYSVDECSSPRYSRTDENASGEDHLWGSRERSITPVPLRMSSKKELKERARSLDNLQHEIRKTPPREFATSMSSLKIIGSIPPENGTRWIDADNQNVRFSDSSDSRRCSTLERDSRSKNKNKGISRACSTLDREAKSHKRMSAVERRTYEKQLEERRHELRLSSPVNETRKTDVGPHRSISDYRRSSSSCSSNGELIQNQPKDEWDKAEEEWLKKKAESDNLRKEIVNVAKNLRKTSTSPKGMPVITMVNNSTPPQSIDIMKADEKEGIPKTFFFGMDPISSDSKKSSKKQNEEEEINIIGNTVEYSRHSLRPNDRKKTSDSENWNRSLDYKEHNRIKEKEIRQTIANNEDGRKLDRKMDKFVATIERTKSKRIPSPEELSNSITRKGDGGYHSRQNSGSFHLDTEGSDEDNVIRMNLKPILPRRQLELPRFSPNAAWRSLSLESSVRQKEISNEIQESDDVFNVSEDRIHRSTRPTAPPRGNGEKSADSGISGDAGSPGPIQEFEPLTPEKLKSSNGPLAVSSPVSAARLEVKRTWTPAQDLDDNSFEETGENIRKNSPQNGVSALPKLTSRSNMFSKSYMDRDDDSELLRKSYLKEAAYLKGTEPRYFDENVLTHEANGSPYLNEKSKNRSSSSPRERDTEKLDSNLIQGDNWRDNWSMSRSIPNSLNTCDEPDVASNSSRPGRSRSESRTSVGIKQGDQTSRPITPSYMQRGNNKHIMYLPEYKSCHYGTESKDQGDKTTTADLSLPNNYERTVFENRKLTYENQETPEKSNGKKGKKFTYQSTVRVLENKKIEKQLSKEAEEKERKRIYEMNAMIKVEQEFQKKREKEKKRIKKQLKIYKQEMHKDKHMEINYSSSSDEKSPSPQSYKNAIENHKIASHLMEKASRPSAYIIPSQMIMNGQDNGSSFQSLPVDLNGRAFESAGEGHNGIFSGLKKWVKGKKEPRSGYNSDASSVTVTSISRQDPDGAPAASSRKNGNIRAEIIAAARHRNGVVLLDRDSDSPGNRSPATSVTSKESNNNRRPFTPDSKRTISPDSRKSLSSEPCPLTQELPELRQEHRLYKEYRGPFKKLLLPSLKNATKVSPATHNYRRDFVLGNMSSKGMVHHYDESDRYSRHSNDSKKSKQSFDNSKRCSSADPTDLRDYSSRSHHHHHRLHPSTKPPIPIPVTEMHNGIDPFANSDHNRVPKGYFPHPLNGAPPSRFAQSLITPFNPTKGYRPVSFSPTSSKILSVT